MTRSWMSHAPRRISSNRAGSKPYSDTGRPTTALKPTFGSECPSYIHVCPPSSVSMTRGAASANFVERDLRTSPAAPRCGRRRRRCTGARLVWFSRNVTVRSAPVLAVVKLRFADISSMEAMVRDPRFSKSSGALRRTLRSALMVIRAAPAQYTSAARSISDDCMPTMSPRFIFDGVRPLTITSYASRHTRSMDTARYTASADSTGGDDAVVRQDDQVRGTDLLANSAARQGASISPSYSRQDTCHRRTVSPSDVPARAACRGQRSG